MEYYYFICDYYSNIHKCPVSQLSLQNVSGTGDLYVIRCI